MENVKYQITYNAKNGKCFPEGRVENAVEQFLNYGQKRDGVYEIEVSTFLFIDYVRLRVRLGQLSPDEVIIMYKGYKIGMNDLAQLDSWPEGFGDYTMNIYRQLICGEIKK